jgi:hypothetical protein
MSSNNGDFVVLLYIIDKKVVSKILDGREASEKVEGKNTN